MTDMAPPNRPQGHDAASVPCTCTLACIPQGITEEQTCRLQLENERSVTHIGDTYYGPGGAWLRPLAVDEANGSD